MTTKTCIKCNQILPLDCFYHSKNHASGRNNRCKECVRPTDATKKQRARYQAEYYEKNKQRKLQQHRQYREKHRERLKASHKVWRDKNRSYIKEKAQRYYDQNREAIIAKAVQYEQRRLKADSQFRFIHSVRTLIRNYVRRGLGIKPCKTETILGCGLLEFRAYLEASFEPSMSWENYGEWHIDHIVPISWATTEDEILRLNHYTNLQPLWAKDNFKKSNLIA